MYEREIKIGLADALVKLSLEWNAGEKDLIISIGHNYNSAFFSELKMKSVSKMEIEDLGEALIELAGELQE